VSKSDGRWCEGGSRAIGAFENSLKNTLVVAPEGFDVGDAVAGVGLGHGGAEFKDFDVVGFHEGGEAGKVHGAAAGGAVVARGELDIVDVEAGEVAGEGVEVDDVVDEAEIFLDLGVAGVVPVDDGGAVDFLEEEVEVVLEGEFVDGFTVLDAEPEAVFLGLRDELLEGGDGLAEGAGFFGVAGAGGLKADFLVFGAAAFAVGEHFLEFAAVVLEVHAAEVEDDEGGFDADGELHGLAGVAEDEVVVAGFFGGEFVEVGGGVSDAHGEGTEIVEGGDLDLAGVDGLDDAGDEADADAVAELGVFKAEVADLAQHGAAAGVAAGVPTGRE